MREIRTSGSVGGEGGNILTYPAGCVPAFSLRSNAAYGPLSNSQRLRRPGWSVGDREAHRGRFLFVALENEGAERR